MPGLPVIGNEWGVDVEGADSGLVELDVNVVAVVGVLLLEVGQKASSGLYRRRLLHLLRLHLGIQSPWNLCAWGVPWSQCLLIVRMHSFVHSAYVDWWN